MSEKMESNMEEAMMNGPVSSGSTPESGAGSDEAGVTRRQLIKKTLIATGGAYATIKVIETFTGHPILGVMPAYATSGGRRPPKNNEGPKGGGGSNDRGDSDDEQDEDDEGDYYQPPPKKDKPPVTKGGDDDDDDGDEGKLYRPPTNKDRPKRRDD